jgi:hypothetical protein
LADSSLPPLRWDIHTSILGLLQSFLLRWARQVRGNMFSRHASRSTLSSLSHPLMS